MGMNIQDKLTHYKNAVYLSRSHNTARMYGIGLNHFAEYLESENINLRDGEAQISVEHFINFPAYLLQRGYARQTLGIYVAAADYLFDQLVIEGLLLVEYVDGIRLRLANKEIYK